ncbi:hypothetical protein B0I31_11362 [Saccharothrix carnea]|uniref:Uncharacterized protein n=1 Tax=Saccharothrix carnea TaxID=1280637 RepID=A0A2P8I1R4_SACCR|nr:hypothetical protein B0I31_11362 [Saccharothrix carnea]
MLRTRRLSKRSSAAAAAAPDAPARAAGVAPAADQPFRPTTHQPTPGPGRPTSRGPGPPAPNRPRQVGGGSPALQPPTSNPPTFTSSTPHRQTRATPLPPTCLAAKPRRAIGFAASRLRGFAQGARLASRHPVTPWLRTGLRRLCPSSRQPPFRQPRGAVGAAGPGGACLAQRPKPGARPHSNPGRHLPCHAQRLVRWDSSRLGHDPDFPRATGDTPISACPGPIHLAPGISSTAHRFTGPTPLPCLVKRRRRCAAVLAADRSTARLLAAVRARVVRGRGRGLGSWWAGGWGRRAGGWGRFERGWSRAGWGWAEGVVSAGPLVFNRGAVTVFPYIFGR